MLESTSNLKLFYVHILVRELNGGSTSLYLLLSSLQGYNTIKQKSPFMACSLAISRFCGRSFIPYTSNQQVNPISYATNYKIRHPPFVSRNFLGNPLLAASVYSWRGLDFSNHGPAHSERFRMFAALDVAAAVDVINDLGFDTLTFLAVTVIIVPAFKIIKASPVRLLLYLAFFLKNFLFFFGLLSFGIEMIAHVVFISCVQYGQACGNGGLFVYMPCTFFFFYTCAQCPPMCVFMCKLGNSCLHITMFC